MQPIFNDLDATARDRELESACIRSLHLKVRIFSAAVAAARVDAALGQ